MNPKTQLFVIGREAKTDTVTRCGLTEEARAAELTFELAIALALAFSETEHIRNNLGGNQVQEGGVRQKEMTGKLERKVCDLNVSVLLE